MDKQNKKENQLLTLSGNAQANLDLVPSDVRLGIKPTVLARIQQAIETADDHQRIALGVYAVTQARQQSIGASTPEHNNVRMRPVWIQIMADLGIEEHKMATDDDLDGLTTKIRAFYPSMTPARIQMAFTLAAMDQLPGISGSDHYQNFSWNFVAKVLTSYKQHEGRLKNKAKKLLPASIEPTKTKKDILRIELDYLEGVVLQYFEQWKTGGTAPGFVYADIYMKVQALGLFVVPAETKIEYVKEAKQGLAAGPKAKKKDPALVGSMLDVGGDLEARAKGIAKTRCCMDMFQYWKATSTDVCQLLHLDLVGKLHNQAHKAIIDSELIKPAKEPGGKYMSADEILKDLQQKFDLPINVIYQIVKL